MDTTEVLIILLSIGMSVVLLFTIVALYYAIKIMQSIRSITDKAESIADNVDAASEFFRRSAGPAAFGRMFSNMVDVVKNRGKDKDE